MNDPRPKLALPWRLADMLSLYAMAGVGFVALIVAWWGVSGTTRLSHQMMWVNVGAAGLLIVGAGNCLWLLAGRRAVGERRRLLLDRYEAVGGELEPPHTNGSGPKPVTVTGMRHYHRPGCQLVEGKATSAASVAAHRRARRHPCGMCNP